MTTINCTKCGEVIELSEALTKDIEKSVLAAAHAQHVVELERYQKEVKDTAAKTGNGKYLKQAELFANERSVN